MIAPYPDSFRYSWCHTKRKEEGILLADITGNEVLRDSTDLDLDLDLDLDSARSALLSLLAELSAGLSLF